MKCEPPCIGEAVQAAAGCVCACCNAIVGLVQEKAGLLAVEEVDPEVDSRL
jgi:hypothetical protein